MSLFADSIDFLEDASVNVLILAALGWTQDAQAVTGGHILQLIHGSTRLSRQSADGATSSLILRRAD